MSIRKRFDDLTQAVIDASSMIYMIKAGFLGTLGHALRLVTIPPVLEETGWYGVEVEIVQGGDDDHTTPLSVDTKVPTSGISHNDRLLLEYARNVPLPLISDDRKLLEAAHRLGLVHYNSLMMLLFLKYRRRIDAVRYRELFDRLIALGRYSDDILDRFKDFVAEITG